MSSTLRSVSRSFYLSLRILPPPVRPAMATGYLLCRTADTIADNSAASPPERRRFLERFRQGLESFPDAAGVADIANDLANLASMLSGPEHDLIRRYPESMALFGRLSKTDRSLVQQVVGSVVQGMEYDLAIFGESSDSVKALPGQKELEDYLNWIGGAPGRFWTNVCLADLPGLKIQNREKWMDDGVRFGTGLQMINILRDVAGDLKLGRCYLPETLLTAHRISVEDLVQNAKPEEFLTLYHRLIDDTLIRLRAGLRYLKQLPPSATRLRAAVWWPLSIGLSTLEKLRASTNVLEAPAPIKIKRWHTYWLMGSSFAMLPADRLLGWDFERRAAAASSSF